MASEFAEANLGRLLSFANGRSSPPRADGLPYPVYGSNGVIGYANEVNSDAGSIIIGRVGSYCGSLYFSKQRCWVTDNAIRAVALDDNDPRFLFYLLSTLNLNNWRAGSGQPLLNQDILSGISTKVPEPRAQRAIAHILGTLDDKIELNRRMSETLEAMARALFKSWFVDFEPVRAKMEGRWRRGESLPGLPAHLYDLFPDRLVDSELGEIPEGCGVVRLGDVLSELVSGSRPKGGAAEDGVPSIGAENIIGLGRYDFAKEKYVPREFFEELRRKGASVRPGDVVLYKDGAQIGRKSFFDCGFPHAECAVNEHVFIIRAKCPREQRYLFFWLDQDWMTQEIICLNSNSAQPGINQQGVRSLPFLMSPSSVVQAFDRFSKPLTDRLFAACLESRTLAALRDALLPKLVSGELRVKDAEKFIGRVL